MARRVYVESANSYSPLRQAVLQGLGAASPNLDKNGWPKGRSYIGIAHFRAPYDELSYFQDNTLQGLGAVQGSYSKTLGSIAASETDAMTAQAPGSVKRFLLAGEPVSPLRSNIALPFNQVHPYVYGVMALAAAATSYVSYKRWKKTHPK